MQFRLATLADVESLAEMNQALLRDEGNRAKMTLATIKTHMEKWLQSDKLEAVLFETDEGLIAGYALYSKEVNHIYLKQFFVKASHRRAGVGRIALTWLKENKWNAYKRIQLAVLTTNKPAIDFWHSLSFRDYGIIMEMDIE